MIHGIEYNGYEAWVRPFFEPKLELKEKDTPFSEYVRECRAAEGDYYSRTKIGLWLVRDHIEKKEYRQLAALGEYMRARAHFSFYFDHEYTPELSTTFELFLLHAHYIIDSGAVFEDIYILRVAEAIYDIKFHHIFFYEGHFEPICEQLYHELSAKLLDKQFRRQLKAKRKEVGYYQSGVRDGYEECYYFINFPAQGENYVPDYMREHEEIPE